MAKEKAAVKPEIMQAIEETARATVENALVEVAKLEDSRTDTNHFRAMESLLYNYKALAALVADEAAYMETFVQERSKSITIAPPKGQTFREREDVLEEAQKHKALAFQQTKTRFEEVDRVVRLFSGRKEFVVIRMYYFHEDADGYKREGERYTWEEITDELAARGILQNEKTARRWRSQIVADMAVCMFGRAAALTTQTRRERKQADSCPI